MSSSREIVNVQIGQAGNQVGEKFWEMLLAEHGIDNSGVYCGNDPLQLQQAGVYFDEIPGHSSATRYVPRSIQVDLEPGVCNKLRDGVLGNLFRPDTYLNARDGAGNNWAKGYYTQAEIIDAILEVVRRQAENCNALQGFQILHSLGGGTGSGLGSLILSELREEYPDRMMATFSIFPSPRGPEAIVEPYNAMLTIHQLIENSDLAISIDNEALYEICTKTLKIKHSTFGDLNGLISQVMCGVSTSLRFPGQLNGDLRKLEMNLVPFSRFHFLMPSYAPFHNPNVKHLEKDSVAELAKAIFERENLLVACDPHLGRYLTAAATFRGDISSREAELAVHDLRAKNSQHFIEWIPDNVSISLVQLPPVGQTQAATALSNSTAVQELFQRILDGYLAIFKRRAFLYWYTDQGMDIMDFTEAEDNTRDLIAEYQEYQPASVDDGEEQ